MIESVYLDPKVSIIISNYQGMKFLPKCLQHLMNQTYTNYEVIVVDAGSSDGSVDYIRESFPEVIVIEAGRIGIGEAINIGIKKSSGEIIAFDFNTDEYVFPNWLEKIVNYLKEHNYNIIAGTTRIIYGTDLIDECGVNINFLGRGKKIGHRQSIKQFKFIEKAVTYTGLPAFHRNLLKKIGLVDEEYYIYAEDLDFCYRASKMGYKTYCHFQARSYHQISETIGSNPGRYEFFAKRAQIRFQFLYFSPIRLSICLAYSFVYNPLSDIIRCLLFPRRSKYFFNKAMAELKAIFWNLTNLRKTVIRRKKLDRWFHQL